MSYRETILEAKRQYWLGLIEQCQWNVSRAAREAKVNRQAVHRMLKQHQIVRVVGARRVGRWQEQGL